ncbi:hypothetical protein Q8A73_011228 [Channa argus]|nr:hypothetical protein Q8A73_011228 [Channa argus]
MEGCGSRGKRGIGQREISSPPSPALYGSSVPAESSFSRGPGLGSSRGTGVEQKGVGTRPNKERSFKYRSQLWPLIGQSGVLRHCFAKRTPNKGFRVFDHARCKK